MRERSGKRFWRRFGIRERDGEAFGGRFCKSQRVPGGFSSSGDVGFVGPCR
jgi:hypothetical protein